jgi:DNA-binding NtrC family response regulator
MQRRVLIVEPDTAILSSLLQGLGSSAQAEGCTAFSLARTRLVSNQYDRLVTNLRLEAHNGLHLVYLARSRALQTRCIVYTDVPELALAQEVQESGAFYESRDRLQQGIRAYIESDLPPSDRRHPSFVPRRAAFRGGRRHSDQPVHVTL